MNKTIITRKIDGIDIVVGFGELSIDPMATRPVVAAAIQNTDEFKAVKSAQDKRNAAVNMAGGADKLARKAAKKADKEKRWGEKLNYLEQANGHENEIKGLLPACKAKKAEMVLSHAVYFEPKSGETVVADSEIDNLKVKMDDGLVDIKGNTIPDNRGVVHATKKAGKWTVTQIKTLNVSVPNGGIIYADLDETQREEVDLQIEINYAAGLSAADKITTKASAVNQALSNAAGLRSRLEISGSADPLAESQDWYNSRLTELDLIYG